MQMHGMITSAILRLNSTTVPAMYVVNYAFILGWCDYYLLQLYVDGVNMPQEILV